MGDTQSFTPGFPLATWTRGIEPSVLQETALLAQRSDSISFALGMPAPELFPIEAYTQALAYALRQPQVTQYGLPGKALKTQIVHMMKARGCECKEEDIFLVAGAQQGMSLITSLLLDKGRQMMVEEYTYGGIHQVAAPLEPEVLTIPIDPKTGLDVDALEQKLRAGARPAFIYTIPQGHNPVAVNMSLEKRKRLIDLARAYQVPIIEDDAYGFLSYAEEQLPTLYSLDRDWVCYVGSFSKILAPGLRVGWVIVPNALHSLLGAAKNAQDLQTSTLTQYVLAAYLENNPFDDYLALLKTTYRERRDTMLEALQRYFPSSARWFIPSTGIFIWVEMEEKYDIASLSRRAIIEEGVAFIPGRAFISLTSDTYKDRFLRLNFSHPNPASIQEGIKRLGRLIEKSEEYKV